jgi:hypothetical protein
LKQLSSSNQGGYSPLDEQPGSFEQFLDEHRVRNAEGQAEIGADGYLDPFEGEFEG